MNANDDKTMLDLVERLKSDDQEAWNELLTQSGGNLKAHLRKRGVLPTDTEDVFQEVILAARKKIGSFTLDSEKQSLEPWLYGIARHKIADYFEDIKKENMFLEELVGELKERAEKKEIPIKKIEDSMTLLEPVFEVLHKRTKTSIRDLQIFYESACTKKSVKDIAEKYKISAGNVAKIKSTVLKKIRENERLTRIVSELMRLRKKSES